VHWLALAQDVKVEELTESDGEGIAKGEGGVASGNVKWKRHGRHYRLMRIR